MAGGELDLQAADRSMLVQFLGVVNRATVLRWEPVSVERVPMGRRVMVEVSGPEGVTHHGIRVERNHLAMARDGDPMPERTPPIYAIPRSHLTLVVQAPWQFLADPSLLALPPWLT